MRIATCILVALVSALGLVAGEVPREAPALQLKTTDGKVVSLADLKGKVVAVLWISTDCPHCQDTCESLAPIYSELSGQGFEIMGMAVNPRAPGNIDAFKRKHGVQFPLAALGLGALCRPVRDGAALRAIHDAGGPFRGHPLRACRPRPSVLERSSQPPARGTGRVAGGAFQCLPMRPSRPSVPPPTS